MKVKQVSVFLENRAGRMAEVARLLGENDINIRALSIADTANFGILRLIVNDVVRAENVFREAGFTVDLTDVIAIEVPDTPGGLASILDTLNQAGFSIEYLYAFVEKSAGKAVVVFRFEDTEAVLKVINTLGIRALTAEQVYAM
ncbi:MAG: ACT domain-containing protein [Kiritimatiellae bacterium]|nr:ACT domain-containing protein [Kiritimatiellia bacterium]MDD4735134.1 ACT domain-containing protein [Kiritimatiellia bacterium]